jgi:cytochrome c nitrite reductase small subunit
MLGLLAGLGGYTFIYAEGLSYFGTDPKACVNCHVMNDQYASWQRTVHHNWATCADCHLPAHGVEKYVAKARNGWNHSRAFTMMDFPDPIQITPPNAAILQENCIRCHEGLVDSMHANFVGNNAEQREGTSCVHCHQWVGHGMK